jgi:hypothetical protein
MLVHFLAYTPLLFLSRTHVIYRKDRKMELLENPTELSGENVLPGFILNLHRIWR